MDRLLSLPAQEFVRACERIGQFASNHKGLDEDDCEAIKLHARELLRDVLSNCAEHHQHDTSQERAA